MKIRSIGITLLLLLTPAAALDLPTRRPLRMATLTELRSLARERVGTEARLPLADPAAESISSVSLEPAGSGRIPNYLRAFAVMPPGAKPFAHLFRTFIFGGTVPPELKLAMGLRIAQVTHSPYAAAHFERLLHATARGKETLDRMRVTGKTTTAPRERAALEYAEWLTRDVHGITDGRFAATRRFFNDSQLIELTMAVSFFNYFTRFCEALNLPVEPWVLDGNSKPAIPPRLPEHTPPARIGLVTDEEMKAVVSAEAASKDPATRNSGLGLAIANSQRAMLRVPDLQAAWRGYGTTVRTDSRIGRELQLQISLAVSMVNGCRYCIVHQVVGLRRLGVDPARLVALRRDDSALTPRELAAVSFARKITVDPGAATDADFAALRREFGDYGALEVLLQTCAFNFMNRFTDNLRLPSEDEAIEVYLGVFAEK